jgi:Xaa-Pro dipeptidase
MTDPSELTARLPMPEELSPLDRRRADIDAKQQVIARIIADLGCEAAMLLMPAHVSWFTCGMAVRGLVADSERPGIYTNGLQRWLVCGNVDTHRVFDEELDGLGFQLKEWQWTTGRANLLGELIVGKTVAVDRPYPGLPLINERLRHEIRPLTQFEFEQMQVLGRALAHALEASAKDLSPGETEADVAGEIAHRLMRRGATAEMVSVIADDRATVYRRSGFTTTPITHACTLQATASMHGLHATASRTVHIGPAAPGFRDAFDTACKLSAIYRSMSKPEESIATAGEAGKWLLANTPYEFEWRLSQPGFGTGRLHAEELRRMGQDEPFGAGQSVVWQARIGPAAVVDTVVVSPDGPFAVTPPEDWPFKRIRLKDRVNDVPDLLVR